jgi:hypothetical protein
MVSKPKNTHLPKWLIAEDVACEKWFIIHTEFPRFIGEIIENDDGSQTIGFPKGEIEMIDNYPADEKAAQKLAPLMRQAGEALTEYDEISEIKAEQARLEEEDD